MQILDSEKILKFAKKQLLKLSESDKKYCKEDVNTILEFKGRIPDLDEFRRRPELVDALSDFLTLMILALEEHERKNTKATITQSHKKSKGKEKGANKSVKF